MPKDPTKNIFQYKIRGGHLNEFEYQQNQGQVKEQHDRPWEKENFDPNAALPGHDPASASPKAQAKGPRLGARPGKQAKSATESTRKQPGKAMKKATKKAVNKSAKTNTKSAQKKSSNREAGTARISKKASTTRRSAKK